MSVHDERGDSSSTVLTGEGGDSTVGKFWKHYYRTKHKQEDQFFERARTCGEENRKSIRFSCFSPSHSPEAIEFVFAEDDGL